MNTPASASLPVTSETMAAVCAARRGATVFHPDGIHIQPAHELSALARRFRSVIRIVADGRRHLASSPLDILSAHLHYGKQVTVEAEGPDADSAVATLEWFFKRRSEPVNMLQQVLLASGIERLRKAA